MQNNNDENKTNDPLSYKKNALVLFSSPHDNGYTYEVLDKLISELSFVYQFTTINAYKENIKPCIDCKMCHIKNSCVFDDFNHIHEELIRAELLIIATPIYNLSFPAPLKAIFDRMQKYFCARIKRNIRPTFKIPKQAVLILTQGDFHDSGINIVKQQLKLIFSVIDTKLISEIIWKGTDFNTPFNSVLPQIAESVSKLTG